MSAGISSVVVYLIPWGSWSQILAFKVRRSTTPLNSDSFPSKLTEKEAQTLLLIDIQQFIRLIQKQVKVSLTQGQFDALVCFSFNTGCIGKTMLKKLNNKDYQGCAEEFDKWVFATVKGEKIKLSGLIVRRKAEKELFLS